MRDRPALQGTAGRAGRVLLDVGPVERAGPGPDGRPEGSGQRARRSGSLAAISTATMAWC